MKQEELRTINDGVQLSEAELNQVSGGVLPSSPIIKPKRPPSTQWSGEPYQPEEDVEAY